MPTINELHDALLLASDRRQAILSQRFFKTGPGEYAEGDRFLGIKVPVIRQAIQEYRGLAPTQYRVLLRSPWHEVRLAGLLLLVDAFARGDAQLREQIFRMYLRHGRHINNWDLVDLSAPQIVGGSLGAGNCAILKKLARDGDMWQRRIAILATLQFIRQRQYRPTLELCRILLGDKEDLMHKACGWMLREVGKRDRAPLLQFLDQYTPIMPRTMLRYAIEHFSARERKHYLGLPRRGK